MDKITIDIRENKYLPKANGIVLGLFIQLPKGMDITTFESRENLAKKLENILNNEPIKE